MFQNSSEADAVFEAAGRKEIFVMEALWSRFCLPCGRQGNGWQREEQVGRRSRSALLVLRRLKAGKTDILIRFLEEGRRRTLTFGLACFKPAKG